jgi:hypothetical protein
VRLLTRIECEYTTTIPVYGPNHIGTVHQT